MAKRHSESLKSAALAAFVLAAPLSAGALFPQPVQAQTSLPAPHVSRALDAVLLPVDGTVIAAFDLAPDTRGVLVLATRPGGLAEASGILPGDVLDYVQGTAILSPADLDLIIYNWILQGITDFVFDGLRDGQAYASETVITLDYWEETVEITEISTWESLSYESFSYEEFYAEFSDEMTASYEETVVEESATEDGAATDDGIDEGMSEDPALDEVVDEGGGDEGYDEGGEEDFIE